MPEIPDRVPGGIILASYANDIRDRTAQRYASAVERDSLTPLPGEGALAYLADQDVLQVFQGGLWTNVAEEPWVVAITDPLGSRLTELEAIRDSWETSFTSGVSSLGTSLGNITSSLTANTAGTYEIELWCNAAVTTAGQTGLGGLTFSCQVNSVQVEAMSSFGTRINNPDDTPVETEWGVALKHVQALAAGDSVKWMASRSASFTTAGEVEDRRLVIRRVA